MILKQLFNKNNHLKLNEFSIRNYLLSEIPEDDYFLFSESISNISVSFKKTRQTHKE